MLLGRKVTTIVNQPDKRWHQAKPTIALCPEHGTHTGSPRKKYISEISGSQIHVRITGQPNIVNIRKRLGMMMTSGYLIGVSFGWNAFKVGKIDILIPSSSTLVVLAALDAPGLVIVNS